MISKIAGTVSRPAIRTKLWWAKLAAGLLISNVFFFMLFSTNENLPAASNSVPKGWVEMQVRAELLTPFQSGKKVLLLQRVARKKVEAMLEKSPEDPEGRFIVLVRESDAEDLLKHESWEIIPYLKTLSFAKPYIGETHEIRY